MLRGEGSLVCRECFCGGEEEELSPEVLALLLRTRFEGLAQMSANEPEPSALSGVEAICREVRRHFLQGELKSYRVMQQTLAAQP